MGARGTEPNTGNKSLEPVCLIGRGLKIDGEDDLCEQFMKKVRLGGKHGFVESEMIRHAVFQKVTSTLTMEEHKTSSICQGSQCHSPGRWSTVSLVSEVCPGALKTEVLTTIQMKKHKNLTIENTHLRRISTNLKRKPSQIKFPRPGRSPSLAKVCSRMRNRFMHENGSSTRLDYMA